MRIHIFFRVYNLLNEQRVLRLIADLDSFALVGARRCPLFSLLELLHLLVKQGLFIEVNFVDFHLAQLVYLFIA